MIRALLIPFLLVAAGAQLAIGYGAGPTVVLHPSDFAVRFSLTAFALVAVVAAVLLIPPKPGAPS